MSAGSEVRMLVKAGPHNRRLCHVEATLEVAGSPTTVMVKDTERGAQVEGQILETKDGKAHIIWLVDELRQGTERRYAARFSDQEPGKGVELVALPQDRVEVRLGDKPFTTYHFSPEIARPCLYPLAGPTGAGITRNYPMAKGPEGETTDHKHHRSVWVAHGDVNGVDNWSEERDHGKTVHRSFRSVLSGPVLGELIADADWLSASGEKVLSERRAMIFYNLDSPYRVIDFIITFQADKDVVFGDTKEGGILSVRVATTMDGARGGIIRNSYGGLTERETWGKRAHWCDYTGPVDGKLVGITIMDYPDNFRYPTYWHVRDYGLFTANPFGLSHFYGDKSRDGTYKLPAGQRFRFCYRMLIHAGDALEAQVADKYHEYVNPPSVNQE